MAQLLSNLPIGAKVKFGKHSVNGETPQDITWLIVAKNHSGYPSNSVTLLAEKIIDVRCIDAREPSNTSSAYRKDGGSNRYSLSNIDQWLNNDSSAGGWYIATHSVDQSPNDENIWDGAPYVNRPGFLNSFTSVEKSAILSSTISVTKTQLDGSGVESITRKVFLPSAIEVGAYTYSEGSTWSYFVGGNNGGRMSYYTAQVIENSTTTLDKTTSAQDWWLRTPNSEYPHASHHIFANGNISMQTSDLYVCCRSRGIRPALNISSNVKVSDTTDSDGRYTTVWNSAPTQPTTLNVPTIYGGKSNAISWSSATDPDGDTVTYTLECSLNGGTYSQIYSGTSTVYAHLVPFGTTSVAYRVKATDPSGESSAYTTSNTVNVINNNAPVIDGNDANLGVKSSGFTGTYKVTDANNNTVTVTESIDGVQIRSLVATLGQNITYGITGNTWLALANGSHTLTIRATDGIDSTVRTYTFTKLVETLTIRNSTPWVSTTMPSRIMLVITRNIPSESTFKVEVCNNGYDTAPAWEDCTDAVKSGLVHVFTNKAKTAGNWGVVVRVTVNRNGATGACYISAIGGNFE